MPWDSWKPKAALGAWRNSDRATNHIPLSIMGLFFICRARGSERILPLLADRLRGERLTLASVKWAESAFSPHLRSCYQSQRSAQPREDASVEIHSGHQCSHPRWYGQGRAVRWRHRTLDPSGVGKPKRLECLFIWGRWGLLELMRRGQRPHSGHEFVAWGAGSCYWGTCERVYVRADSLT